MASPKKYMKEVVKEGKRIRWPKREELWPAIVTVIVIAVFVASLIGFTISTFGVVGMTVAVLPWPTYIFGIGIVMLVCVCASSALWVCLLRSKRLRIREFD